MAYKAKSLALAPNQPNAFAARGPVRDVAGVRVTSKPALYAGDPPAELLACDEVHVMTLEGKPWPDSSCDRNANNASRRRMAEKKASGKWPTDRERELQKFVEAKIADPDGVGRHVLASQGYRPDEIEKIMARSKASTRGVPTLPSSDDPPKRRPGRPRKTEE